MERKRVLIWTLNATERLLADSHGRIEAIFRGFPFGPSRARFADRREFSAEGPPGPRSNLMPDEEYFVPIAAKCIGGLFDEPGRREALAPLRAHFEAKWNRGYADYWESMSVRGREGETRMLTPRCTGYYSILEAAAAAGHENVLLGYSQGGLVARYLAWLDGYLGGKAVRGVITLASPNFGSPLANPANREGVVDGIVRTAAALVSLSDPVYEPLVSRLSDLVDFEDVYDAFGLARAAVASDRKLDDETRADALRFLGTGMKWLSGLHPRDPSVPATAFGDLDIFTMRDTWSVLSCVQRDPPRRTLHAAVVNADGSFADFVRSAVGALLYFILGVPLSGATILGRRIIPDDFLAMGRIYSARVMAERRPGPEPLPGAAELAIERLERGEPKLGLPARAHDFVVPSAYQTIEAAPESRDSFLGMWVNHSSNHISGQSPRMKGGRRNIAHIKRGLRAMRDRGL